MVVKNPDMFRRRVNCYICNIGLQPRAMVSISGNENELKRQIAIRRREDVNLPPRDIEANCRICLNCNRTVNAEIDELARDPDCLKLNVLKQTTNNSCMFCNGLHNLSRLSVECRVKVFIIKNIYIPESARCCHHHLDANGFVLRVLLEGLQFYNRPYRLNGAQLQNILQVLRRSARIDEPDFNDENSFTEDEFRSISPITRQQFQDLCTYCDPVPVPGQNTHRHISKRDLLLFLCKLRQGLSDDFLKVIFRYTSRQAVSLVITTVRRSLMVRFVPLNIGLNSITREQYIQRHVTDFANELYNSNRDLRVAIAYIDGTYAYIQKSSNFRALRQSYSVHKGRHLIKPALVVAPDGYILDIHGPYFSDSRNNDASMLRNEFEVDANGLREWFNNDDIFIVDRGYSDVLPLLENIGINYKMPSRLERGERQLNTEEANDSRLITKTRWIVEARNGHIKSVFNFFEKIIPMHHAINIGDFYRIAGAILNKYREPILMEGANAELAQIMLEKSQTPNVLQARVEIDNLHTRNARWVHLIENHIPLFPRLNLDYLKELTVGIYQVNLAPAYVQDKLQREDSERFEYDELGNEPGLIRVRIYSRFRNATKYQLWIAYHIDDDVIQQANEQDLVEDNEPILGYYCTCKTGARTLGSCAHVASVLWFLGYARHQPRVKYPSTAMLANIIDAGHRPRQEDIHPVAVMEQE